MFQQVAIVRRRVLEIHTHLVWVTQRRPTCLRHHNLHVAVAQHFHCRVDSVHLCVEHVGVCDPRELIVNPTVRLEDAVV